jgi:hypothetical protein
MRTTPSADERGPGGDVAQALSLAAYVGIAVGFLGLIVLMCVAGVVDERIAPLWNPAVLAAAAAGTSYAEPRRPLWQVGAAGAVLGLAYAGLVLGADALSGLRLYLPTGEILLRALGIGVGPALAGGLLLRWFASASGRRPV